MSAPVVGGPRWRVPAMLGGLLVTGGALWWVSGLVHGVRPPAARAAEPLAGADGKQLYAVHCLQCHGDKGDGEGPAARFLYPKPRNFTEAKFRLASTANLMPTDDDLLNVITRGMPGSAMFPFGYLSEPDRRALVAYVRTLTRTGFAEKAKQEAEAAGEKVEMADVLKQVDEILKPGDKVAIPADWPKPDAASIARGKAEYDKSCATCHGATGKGDGAQDQRDSNGMPTVPRDFSRGIFKGGREREQLFARIQFGMLGTPMPANNLPPAQIADMVNFIHSFSGPETQQKVEHRRQALIVRRVAAPLPGEVPDALWGPTTRIVVSPLWWRNYAEPDLNVAMIHDGQTIALRMSWRDETRNDLIAKPEDFEDMCAVQLFQGAQEPFLGMGSATAAPEDLWLWRATWHRPKETVDHILDEYPFDTPLYRDRAVERGRPIPDFATARAAGNPHTHADVTNSAANMTAKGFGTVTFRPRAAQNVSARSSWKDGQWTVVFRRALAEKPGEGLTFTPGSRSSVAFAVWDGVHRDRNGQKLVSIWHDLKFE